MNETMEEDQPENTPDVLQETPPAEVFIAPSIHHEKVLAGESYTHHSAIPQAIREDMTTECVLGIDEAGRGPVLGPMVYGLFYLPTTFHHTLLTQTYKFNDSKLLTPTFRSHLMQQICSPETPLYTHCGWAIRSLSAQDISSSMLRPTHTTGSSNGTPQISNLNNQAIEATITLIHQILYDLKINIQHIYIDTIGKPEIYQARLEKIFPAVKITVAKKADSLFPCVSAASVCAKVTRDAALEVLYGGFAEGEDHDDDAAEVKTTTMAWGSGYPSDVRCANWLKNNMDPVFGWGNECRFSWGTAKELLEVRGAPCRVDWPEADDAEENHNMKLTGFFTGANDGDDDDLEKEDELGNWYGRRVTEEVF